MVLYNSKIVIYIGTVPTFNDSKPLEKIIFTKGITGLLVMNSPKLWIKRKSWGQLRFFFFAEKKMVDQSNHNHCSSVVSIV